MKIITPMLVASLFILMAPAHSVAQTYPPIDPDALLYCGDFPHTDSQIVRYDPVAGEVAFVNPEAVIGEYQGQLNALKKRRKALGKLHKRERDKNFVKRFRRNYKLAFGKKFKGGAFKAERALGKTIRRVAKEMSKIKLVLRLIDQCENNEIASLPTSGQVRFIEFEFTHPDFNVTYYMHGIGVLFHVKPGKRLAPACKSFGDSGGFQAPVFPRKTVIIADSNPCALFYPSPFRNFPNCSGEMITGSNFTRVDWVDDVSISTRPRTERERERLEERVIEMGPVIISKYHKKRHCNY